MSKAKKIFIGSAVLANLILIFVLSKYYIVCLLLTDLILIISSLILSAGWKKGAGIIIALIVFFALSSYAVTQSGRGGGDRVSPEQYAAAWLSMYGGDIRLNVARMMKNGVKAADLDFTLPDEPEHKISIISSLREILFSAIDKNSVYDQVNILPSPSEVIPSNAFDGPMQFVYTDSNRIQNLGTDIPEIIFITWPIRKDICELVNYSLGLDTAWIISNSPDLTPLDHETNQPLTEIEMPTKHGLIRLESGVACAQDKNGVRYYIHTIVER